MGGGVIGGQVGRGEPGSLELAQGVAGTLKDGRGERRGLQLGGGEPGGLQIGGGEPGALQIGGGEAGDLEVGGRGTTSEGQIRGGVAGKLQLRRVEPEAGVPEFLAAQAGGLQGGRAVAGDLQFSVGEPGSLEFDGGEPGTPGVEVGAGEPGGLQVGGAEPGTSEFIGPEEGTRETVRRGIKDRNGVASPTVESVDSDIDEAAVGVDGHATTESRVRGGAVLDRHHTLVGGAGRIDIDHLKGVAVIRDIGMFPVRADREPHRH